jgi:hypothetical protein
VGGAKQAVLFSPGCKAAVLPDSSNRADSTKFAFESISEFPINNVIEKRQVLYQGVTDALGILFPFWQI